MSLFCNKYGKECPHTNSRAQSYNCDAWDPRDFLADKSCRHALTVDNMELAKMQWIARNKDINGKNKRIETPERPKPQPVIMNKTGEIDAKQTAILQRLELEKRQTAAAEQIAREHEDTRTVLVHNLDRIATALEKLAGWFGDDEEGDE